MYILIDSETRAPVPLPFHTETADGDPAVIVAFEDGNVWFRPLNERTVYFRPPEAFGMELITEADFMKERE